MKTRLTVMAAILSGSLTLPCRAFAAPSGPSTIAGTPSEHVPGEVLVKFRSSVTAQRVRAAVAHRGHSLLAHLTGRAIDAMASVAYIHAPTGLTATVQ